MSKTELEIQNQFTPERQMIGVDLDGTMIKWDGWQGPEYLGAPLLPMIDRVRDLIRQGHDVWIYTARYGYPKDRSRTKEVLEGWSQIYFGKCLPITSDKAGFDIMFDDRAIQMVPNTGRTLKELIIERLNQLVKEMTNNYFGQASIIQLAKNAIADIEAL